MRIGGRLHAPALTALADAAGTALHAPRPGIFVPAVARGDLVAPGGVVGHLVVLGQSFALASDAGGFVAEGLGGPRAVAYGDVLVALDPEVRGAPAAARATAAPAAADDGLVFRAPTSGRFYSRSAPDKPPYVEAGTELAPGATICLLEVMKTFHRVTYGGAGLPERARVRAVLVADGADVNAADPLLALE